MKELSFTDPFFIGFEDMFDTMKIISNSKSTYPPYDLYVSGESNEGTKYTIEMAVAGFREEDIEVTLKDGKLNISGCNARKNRESYMHKGIANRSFERGFYLADNVEVKDVILEHGMLCITLETFNPPQPEVQKIPINKDKNKTLYG